ncbi:MULTISPECIES: transporter [Paenibacillus]|uniref:transporter n=1 Tax=Paenibacillus TaxID=44249 RepID=UPI000433FA05|nr:MULTISPECIES: transporter [Paenibacillus]KKC48482.1 transporter [Paenibacillus sp. D9]CDN42145.1 hypothetical protein BN871_AV_00330 [Paenibacillus sp. P22]
MGFMLPTPPGFPGGFPGGAPGGFPGGSPGGFPGGFPGGTPGGVPGAGGAQPPSSPPPQGVPQKPLASAFAVDPGAISGCSFRFTYIWPRFGPGFWFYPVFVGRTSVAGFRWTGFSWAFSGLDLQSVESFTC